MIIWSGCTILNIMQTILTKRFDRLCPICISPNYGLILSTGMVY